MCKIEKEEKKDKSWEKCSYSRFRSYDLRVMSPAPVIWLASIWIF